jgi:hypothetical protein
VASSSSATGSNGMEGVANLNFEKRYFYNGTFKKELVYNVQNSKTRNLNYDY